MDKNLFLNPKRGFVLSIVVTVALLTLASRSLLLPDLPEMDMGPDHGYKQSLLVVADKDYAPYSYYDKEGKPAGYEVELIYTVGKYMGLNIDLRLMSWAEAKSAIRSDEAEILLGLEHQPESLPDFSLAFPFESETYSIFGRQDLSRLSELYDKKIAALDGSGSIASFIQPYRLQEEMSYFQNYPEAFEAVRTGKCDYVIARRAVGHYLLKQIGDSSIKNVGPSLAVSYFTMGVKKGNEALLEQLNNILLDMAHNGSLKELRQKWLQGRVEDQSVWEILRAQRNFILALVILLAGGFLLFYSHMNRKIAKLALQQKDQLSKTLEYQRLINEATHGLYESILEFDITHDRAQAEGTLAFLRKHNIDPRLSCTEILTTIAATQVHKDFSQGYLERFLPKNALAAYAQGITHQQYELLILGENNEYSWMRIIARLFYWSADASVRMISYRQDIDAEKKQEHNLKEEAQKDGLTGLYNKKAVESLVKEKLRIGRPNQLHAMFVLDIDHFKLVNDNHGHAFGDLAINQFSKILHQQFRSLDIVGRIGGDEFAVFAENIPSIDWAREHGAELVKNLHQSVTMGEQSHTLTASIGIALFPSGGTDFATLFESADSALYLAKERGRNGYVLHGDTVST